VRKMIIDKLIEKFGEEPFTIEDLAKKFEKDRKWAYNTMCSMGKRGLTKRVGRGTYHVTAKAVHGRAAQRKKAEAKTAGTKTLSATGTGTFGGYKASFKPGMSGATLKMGQPWEESPAHTVHDLQQFLINSAGRWVLEDPVRRAEFAKNLNEAVRKHMQWTNEYAT
jgi:hypothetical protein